MLPATYFFNNAAVMECAIKETAVRTQTIASKISGYHLT